MIKFADVKTLRDFFGYANKSRDFLGRQVLKLGFFWLQNINLCWAPIVEIHVCGWGTWGHMFTTSVTKAAKLLNSL